MALEAVCVPFLKPLFPEGVERGKAIGAFFAPAAEWRLIVTAIVASRLKVGLRSGIVTTTRFPKEICNDMVRFEVDVNSAFSTGLCRIADWYTCVTGRLPAKPPEDMATSLRVADLGVISAKQWNIGQGINPEANPEYIEFALFDNLTRLFSYNDEISCIKFLNTTLARMKQDMRISIYGFATQVLDKKTYADLESMCDGIIDVRTIEVEDAEQTVVRVRSFPEVRHTKGWHAISVQGNLISLTPVSKISRQPPGSEFRLRLPS